MAYPNYGYPQYQSQPMYPAPQQMNQPQIQQQMPVQQVAQPPQMQSGGFISVPSEQVARNYPVAPGNVMTFKIENQPYVCEKAQGFSQLEGPIFNKYRLVKEDEVVEPEAVEATVDDDLRRELDELKEEVRLLKEKIYAKPKSLSRENNQQEGNRNRGGHRNE